MNKISRNEKIARLQEIILREALFKTEGKRGAVSRTGNPQKWLFDIRQVCLKPEFLKLVAEIFWETFEKEYPFQIGGQELAAIPLVTAIVLHGKKIGKPVNGFIIRKSRKISGLQKTIEGKITEEKIILIDDAVNSGRTISHGIKALRQMKKETSQIFFLVDCGDGIGFDSFKKENIKFNYLLDLSDFDLTLPQREIIREKFDVVWRFASPDPNYFFVVPKSAPAIDDSKAYFGSDSGIFWALNQNDGSVAWEFQVGYSTVQGKSIFSSPAVFENFVYFGSYDGNVYALDKNSGEIKWKFGEADWVGSSPVIAPDLGLLFIGLEFGLFRKKGGIVALDFETGKKIWDFRVEEFIHCSPAYCTEKRVVAIGGNDHYVYMFKAKNGKFLWKFKTDGEIKASFEFDSKRNLVLFGSFDKNLYALDIDSGELKGKFETKDIIFSTPKVYEDNVYITSTDKNLYSFSLETGKLNWRFEAGGRIFSSAEIVEGKVLFGATDGVLYEIEIESGKCKSIFQTAERITNKITYNPITNRYFVLTYANEIYCLDKDLIQKKGLPLKEPL